MKEAADASEGITIWILFICMFIRIILCSMAA